MTLGQDKAVAILPARARRVVVFRGTEHRPGAPALGGSRPLYPVQGSFFNRPVRGDGAARLLRGQGTDDVRCDRLAATRPPRYVEAAGARYVDWLAGPGIIAGDRDGVG